MLRPYWSWCSPEHSGHSWHGDTPFSLKRLALFRISVSVSVSVFPASGMYHLQTSGKNWRTLSGESLLSFAIKISFITVNGWYKGCGRSGSKPDPTLPIQSGFLYNDCPLHTFKKSSRIFSGPSGIGRILNE